MVDLLLAHGADREVKTGNGLNAAAVALSQGHGELALFLHGKGGKSSHVNAASKKDNAGCASILAFLVLIPIAVCGIVRLISALFA